MIFGTLCSQQQINYSKLAVIDVHYDRRGEGGG